MQLRISEVSVFGRMARNSCELPRASPRQLIGVWHGEADPSHEWTRRDGWTNGTVALALARLVAVSMGRCNVRAADRNHQITHEKL